VSAEELADLKKMLQKETHLRKAAEGEVNNLKNQVAELKKSEVCFRASNIYIFHLHVLFSPCWYLD